VGDSDATLADLDEAVFLFTFPAIQSAIKIFGDNQGMRAQMEIPESEMGGALKMLQWRGGVMEARVRLVNDGDQAVSRRSAKKRIEQSSPGM